MLLSQNYQEWGIITLSAGVVVAAEMLARGLFFESSNARFATAAPLLAAFFLAPTIVHCFSALVLHAAVAVGGTQREVDLPGFSDLYLANLWTPGEHDAGTRYLNTLESGAEALRRTERSDRVLAFDFVSPFSAGLGLVPPHGDSPWHHWGRTLNEKVFPDPGQLLADVETVMVPKHPVEGWTSRGLNDLYKEYIAREFELIDDGDDWTLYARKRPQ